MWSCGYALVGVVVDDDVEENVGWFGCVDGVCYADDDHRIILVVVVVIICVIVIVPEDGDGDGDGNLTAGP